MFHEGVSRKHELSKKNSGSNVNFLLKGTVNHFRSLYPLNHKERLITTPCITILKTQ